jgi:two-component system, sensor histidine kinase YesM
MLTISGKAQNGCLLLTVEDDGMGIPTEELNELRTSIESDSFEDSKNFALKNINRQIRLKYGQEYGISIDSVYEKGTEVSIKLPEIRE